MKHCIAIVSAFSVATMLSRSQAKVFLVLVPKILLIGEPKIGPWNSIRKANALQQSSSLPLSPHENKLPNACNLLGPEPWHILVANTNTDYLHFIIFNLDVSSEYVEEQKECCWRQRENRKNA